MFKMIEIPSVKSDKEKFIEEVKSKTKSSQQRYRNVSYHPLVIFEVINTFYSMKTILIEELNFTELDLAQTNIHCPFHGEVRGMSKPSAVYYPDSDSVYCYSESKSFKAYHALKLAGRNIKDCFDTAWLNLPMDKKEEILSKHGEGGVELEIKEKYKRYGKIFDDFAFGKIDFHKYKNALRKIFIDTYNSDRENKLKGKFNK